MDHILPLSLSDWVYYRVGTPSLLIGGGDESALARVPAMVLHLRAVGSRPDLFRPGGLRDYGEHASTRRDVAAVQSLWRAREPGHLDRGARRLLEDTGRQSDRH